MSRRATQHSARRIALEVLGRYTSRRGDAADLLHSMLETADRSEQATDLVYGVIRNAALLDRLLNRCANVNKNNVKPVFWNILRLGVYELVFSPKTADYAILNEAVEMASAVGSRKSAGFVNAVLRSIQRRIIVRDGDAASAASMQAVPRGDGGVCVFGCEVLPDRSENPAEYLRCAWSLPQWLVRRWVTEYGAEATADICRASNRSPSVYAWPNTCRICAEELVKQLVAEGVQCRLWADRRAVQLRCVGALSRLETFKKGLFYVQDPAAEAVASFLEPQAGQTLIDWCAAPGGKTIALALRMRNTGYILASDASTERLGHLKENLNRLGLSCVNPVVQDDATVHISSLQHVDMVILDVPCSNTGVLARRVEARRRLEKRLDRSVLELQQSLLKTAYALLKPGTKLLYSTCSILPEENEHQIQYFLQAYPHLYLLKQKITFPTAENADSFDHDGGYLALLVRP